MYQAASAVLNPFLPPLSASPFCISHISHRKPTNTRPQVQTISPDSRDQHRPLHLSPSSGRSTAARLSAQGGGSGGGASWTPRHPGSAPSLTPHSPFWKVCRPPSGQFLPPDPQAACCIAAQPSVREGCSLQPPRVGGCHPLPAVPGQGLAPSPRPHLKAQLQKQKHQPLLTVSPSSLSGLKNVAQAAPLWHLGAPQTLGWCLKNSDCLIPLHRELAQILSGPSPTRCRPGSPPL